MTNWLPELAPDRPRYLAIAEAMRADLMNGTLKPGERMPTHRDLAYRLGVTTGTVTRGYAEAEKLGILVGEVGRGSYLRLPAAQPQPYAAPARQNDQNTDLSQAAPPMVVPPEELDRALRQIIASPSRTDLLDYTPAEGHPLHRAMGVTWLKRSGIEVPESQVIVTAGAHAALISTLAALTQHDDQFLVESLNYPTIKPIARHLGITPTALDLDDEGLVPASLEQAARSGQARILYLVPTLQNPTTITLSLERRTAIVEIARRCNLTIIEDDIFRLLDPRLQPPTIYALAPERTWHITSISKTLAAGLRVGFVATPQGKADQLIRHQTVASGRAVGLAAEVARHWIESDAADRILAAIIVENAARRELALEIFRERTISCRKAAPFLWLKLPAHWQPADFTRAAQDRGIRITPGSAFSFQPSGNAQGVRICFGGTVTREGLAQALRTLNSLLDEHPGDEFHAVA